MYFVRYCSSCILIGIAVYVYSTVRKFLYGTTVCRTYGNVNGSLCMVWNYAYVCISKCVLYQYALRVECHDSCLLSCYCI